MNAFAWNDDLRELLLFDAEQRAPQEACGLISAPPARSEGETPEASYWPAHNHAEDPATSFLIHPEEQARLLTYIWGRDEDVVGVFHSHPRSGPKPSKRDRRIAKTLPSGFVWVICGLEPGSLAADWFVGTINTEEDFR